MKRLVIWAAVLLALLGFSSCAKKVTIIVDKLPPNTPEFASIFVTGNFNYWDASDRLFLLKPNENGKLTLELPYGWGNAEFKFTRGDWKTVEKDLCGQEMNNRVVSYLKNNTIHVTISSWADLGPTDCEKAVLSIKVPPETPKNARLYVAANLNDWDPGDTSYCIHPNEKGEYFALVEKHEGTIEFKFTRGGWESEELDADRNPISNREFVLGKQDTVVLEVAAWKDIVPGLECKEITFRVKTPKTTREQDEIYISGTFNDWKPNDETFKLKPEKKNLYSITIVKPEGPMKFKFTRGSWQSEEVNQYQEPIENRQFITNADTVNLHIIGWKDRNVRNMH